MIGDRTLAPRGQGQGEGALSTYLRAIRAHLLLVVIVTLAAVAGAVALTVLLPRQYEASSSVLVSPLPADDPTFLGLGLLRDSGDPTRDVQTAAAVLETFEAAEATAEELGTGWDADSVLDAVRIEPQGESNVLAVIGSDPDAETATRLSNEFTRTALGLRERTLGQQLDTVIEQLESQETDAVTTAPDAETVTIDERLTELQALRERGTDPTLTLSQEAEVPTEPVGAPRWLVLAAALLVGLTLGTLGAYAIESTNPRVRDQEEFVSLFPLQVLSGVPRMPRRQRRPSPVLQPIAHEAYRTLRIQLEQRGPRRTIMVTSASSGDGKTTVAANLAYSMIVAGHSVVLIDFDLRNPSVASNMGMRPQYGLSAALRAETPLSELLVELPHAPGLRVLPAVEGDAVMLESITRWLPDLLPEAATLADYVIMDTPPLGEVSDPLQLLPSVNDVVIVVRPRHTFRRSFQVMRDLLGRAAAEPAGFFVVGHVPQPTYYGYLTVPSGDGAGHRSDRESQTGARSPGLTP